MRVLQITDPHLYGDARGRLRGVETDSSFSAALQDAFTRVADYEAVLITGDLVQDDAAGYLRFRSMFGSVNKPVLCIPGNHDVPEAMRRELDCEPFLVCGAHEIGAWQFVMLDSHHPGHVGGRLAQSELSRLDAALGACAKHTMVCLHHHPVAMASRWLDTGGLAESDEFWRIIDAHSNARAVAWGHVHQVFDGKRGAVRLFGSPSTGAQFLPHSDRFALDTRPPGYRSFHLHADGGIDSEVHWVEAAALCLAAAG